MSKRDQINGAIQNRQVDNAMYSGESLPAGLLDDLFAPNVELDQLRQENETLRQQLEQAGMQIINGDLSIPNMLRFTKVGIEFYTQLTEAEWLEIGKFLGRLNESIQWIVGDWLAYGEVVYGKTYAEASQLVGRSEKTLRNWCYVCANVELSRRRDNLTFSHHALVAGLPPEQQTGYLQQAVEQKLSIRQLESLLNPTPILPASPLTNRKTRRIFSRVWRAISGGGRQIKQEDIDHLRRWLDELESMIE